MASRDPNGHAGRGPRSSWRVARALPRLLLAGSLLFRAFAPPAAYSAETGPTPDATRHWAFQPLHRAALPVPDSSTAPRNLVDFWLAASPGSGESRRWPEAERALLHRRLAFGLTGLPPTPEEIESFRRDRKPGAYERVVERYLASPRYGERWGKHWLDAAGYADSNGYFNADTDRPLAWRYRDYVVRAFNTDKPFDRFVREQLAGDELAGWRPGRPVTPEIRELLEATHFLRNGPDGTGESDGNPDEVRVDRYYALEAAVQIVGSCLLGVTVQCAKCHEHKFEPISQREYYELEAVLYPAFPIEKWVKPNDRIAVAPLPGEREEWKAREQELDTRQSALRREFAEWETARRPRGRVVFEDAFDDGAPLARRWSSTAPGDDRPGGSPAVNLDTNAPPAALIRDGALRLVESGTPGDRWLSTRAAFDWRPARTGEWIQATFRLVDHRLEAGAKPAERIGYFIALHDFADHSEVPGGNLLIDGNPDGPTQVHVDYPGADAKERGTIGATGYQPGHRYGVRVTREGDDAFRLEHVVDGALDGGSIRLAAADLPPGGFGFEFCCGRSFVVDDVAVEVADTANPEWVRRENEFAAQYAERRKTRDEALQAIQSARTPEPGRVAWVSDLSGEAPVVPLLKRGNPKTPGAAVEPGFPGFLAGTKGPGLSAEAAPGAESTGRRLAWARRLTEPGSAAEGLLARVFVNRVWQWHFGVGLVATSDNLGLSGARPSAPELLEALAVDFVESGWSVKALQRVIVQSALYRSASTPSRGRGAEGSGETPWNRFPVQRLDAEAIRDGMLAASGRLGAKTSGPYVPTTRSPAGEVIVDETRADAFSRSLFLQQRRTQVLTMLGLFDAPAVVFNCTRRASTTQPLQALGLLNSEFSVKRAEDFAARLERECGPDPDARLQRAFLLAAGRPPDRAERAAARRFLREQTEAYASAGERDRDRRVWADFCQALLASNAFLYLE